MQKLWVIHGAKEYQGFPTKVIIDPKGNIVETIISENPVLYALLDQLFI